MLDIVRINASILMLSRRICRRVSCRFTFYTLRNNPIFKVSICAESAFFSFFTTTTAKLANAFSESKNTAIPPKKNHKIENVSH